MVSRCSDLQVDLVQLRKLSAVRGLVNSQVTVEQTVCHFASQCPANLCPPGLSACSSLQIRAKVWPLLLGVSKTADSYEDHKVGHHRDSSVVDVDVQRSLWAWTVGEHCCVFDAVCSRQQSHSLQRRLD